MNTFSDWDTKNCHPEWSKFNRERQVSYKITYMCKLKKGYK